MTQLTKEWAQIADEMTRLADEMTQLASSVISNKAPEKSPDKAPDKAPEKAPEKATDKAPEKAPEVPMDKPNPSSGFISGRFPKWVIETAKNLRLNYSVFETAPDSHYSCLMPWGILQTQSIFKKECSVFPKTIIDANANIGCDTAHFAYMFPDAKITAIEMSADTAALLKKNASRFHQYARNQMGSVECVQADCLDYLKNVKADMVYFDPPWCAPVAATPVAATPVAAMPVAAMLRPPRIELSLGGKSIGLIIGETLKNTSLVVVKLPPDYDVESILQIATKMAIYDVYKTRGGLAYRLAFVRK